MFVNTGRTVLDAVQGQALVELNKQRSAEGVKKADILREAGYVTLKKDGTERLNFTAFYQELLYVQGKLAKVRVTVTDTFGGQPNYSWADRYSMYIYRDNPVREVKAELGYTGVKCDKVDMGTCIHLYPRGEAKVIIIEYV